MAVFIFKIHGTESNPATVPESLATVFCIDRNINKYSLMFSIYYTINPHSPNPPHSQIYLSEVKIVKIRVTITENQRGEITLL